MRLEVCDSLRGDASLGHGCALASADMAVDVHGASVALGKEEECGSVAADHGIAVFAGMAGKVCMLARGDVVVPYVACDARGVVLPPFILVALAVLVVESCAVLAECNLFGRCGKDLQGASALGVHLVEFGKGGRGEHGAFGRVHDACAEIDPFPVGREGLRHFVVAVVGEPCGGSACGRHQMDIEVSVTVACKGYLFAVGTPDGVAFIARMARQPSGLASFGGDGIDVTHIAECHHLAVRTNLHVAEPKGTVCCAGSKGKSGACGNKECFLHGVKGGVSTLGIYIKERSASPHFFQRRFMSSRVFPLVSGTRRHTKRAASRQNAPYSA